MELTASNQVVYLRGGLTVPVAPLTLLFELEQLGVTFTVEGDDLVVRPRALLTDDHRAQIRRWKPHLLALLTYQPPEIQ